MPYNCIYGYYNRLNIILLRIFKYFSFIYLESKIITIIYAYSFIFHLISLNHIKNVRTMNKEPIIELELSPTIVTEY
jgi:hypothetical protein